MRSIKKFAAYEKCLVSFLDILGFKNILNSRGADEIASILSEFREFNKGIVPYIPHGVKEHRLNSEMLSEIVSDAVVRVRTTETQQDEGPFSQELYDLFYLQVKCIKKGIIIRGAVQFGDMHVGVDFKGPVFGPALVDAYTMENERVVYPIIAVHEDAIENYINNKGVSKYLAQTVDEELYEGDLISKDSRGIWFIDYLRAYRREVNDIEWINFLRSHKGLIEGELKKDHPGAVYEKFIWLKEYHNGVISKIFQNPKIDHGIEEYGDRLESILHQLSIRG